MALIRQRPVWTTLLATVAVATLATTGCGSSDAQKSNTTTTKELLEPGDAEAGIEDSRIKVDRMATLYAELGNGVDSAGDDCDVIALSIKNWASINRDEVKRLSSELASMPKPHVDELHPSLEAAMRRAALQLRDGNERCPNHQGIFDAISSLPK